MCCSPGVNFAVIPVIYEIQGDRIQQALCSSQKSKFTGNFSHSCLKDFKLDAEMSKNVFWILEYALSYELI